MSLDSGQKASKSLQLRPRAVFQKPPQTTLAGAVLYNVFILKWAEGTHIRGRKERFVFDPSVLTPAEQDLLGRAGLDHGTVARELDSVNGIFSGDPELQFLPMFQRPEVELDKEKDEGEKESGEQLADLNLYFYVMLKKIDFRETEKLIDHLNSLSIVEIAYPQRIPFPAATDIAPVTPDFSNAQSYLEPAPQGIDAFYAWSFSGGQGDFAHIIDVETGWHLDHEDLPDQRSLFHNHGWNVLAGQNHGTAVLGILAAQENEFGITGIVPKTALGVDSPVAFIPPYDVPGAINRAAAALPRGGVLLIEQHYPFGPSATPGLAYSGSWVPVEESQGDFDAIRNATARGIVVVEAAANGGQDLDVPFFERRFDRSLRDSGAILVGAGMPYTGAPEGFSNFGRRVDVHGWGSGVMTLGYDSMVPGAGGDARQRYRSSFGGTSSASPIVAGAAAAIQSIRRFFGVGLLTSVEMRNLLRDTGTQGVASPRNIGPLPNLRKAIDFMRLPGLPAAGWRAFSDFPVDSAPVLVRDASGALACFVVRGSRLWWRSQSGPVLDWGPWLQLGDQPLVGGLAATLDAGGRLHVFGRGVNRELWTIRQLIPGAGSAWSGWTSLGGGLSADPVALTNTADEIELFARGFDDQLYTNVLRIDGRWSDWILLDGRLATRPSVALQSNGALTLLAVFKDRSVRTRTRDAAGLWEADWRDAGGSSRDETALVQNAGGGLDAFVRGLDGALWRLRQTGDEWSPWTRIPGDLAPHTAPAAALSPFGRVTVFVRWRDNTVHVTSQTDEAPFWSALDGARADLGGGVTSHPVVVFHSDGRYEIFARTWNGALITVSHRSGG